MAVVVIIWEKDKIVVVWTRFLTIKVSTKVSLVVEVHLTTFSMTSITSKIIMTISKVVKWTLIEMVHILVVIMVMIIMLVVMLTSFVMSMNRCSRRWKFKRSWRFV